MRRRIYRICLGEKGQVEKRMFVKKYTHMYRFIFRITFLLIFLPIGTSAQSLRIATWNIQDMGQSKNAIEISHMASLLANFDIVAIQEVVGKHPGGAQAVARLADALNRTGNKWDYSISLPTQSPSAHMSERYAFLWKPKRVRMRGDPFLDTALVDICIREPYIATFVDLKNQKPLRVVNFHSRVHNDQPEQEISHFADYIERFASLPFILAGDFNLDEQHEVWDSLYAQSFVPVIRETPTTLKRKCKEGDYLNYPIDNIYVNSDLFSKISGGVLDFVEECDQLVYARQISDHLPVYVELEWAN